MRPLLYGSPESGHSYKIRMALLIAGIAHDYHPIDLSRPASERDPDWASASRFGEVPVLVLEGRAICQSNAILLHLARRYGILGWEHDPTALAEWLGWEANRIGFSLPNYRLRCRDPSAAGGEVTDWLRARMESDLALLDRTLRASPYLMGDTLSAADLSCSAYLLYRDVAAADPASWPTIEDWLGRIATQPCWLPPHRAMRHIAGEQG